MKISIITVCYNSGEYIESAIQSVLNQDYNDFEYIIIDGNSKDRTLEIINKYSDRISKIISEPDLGIYDAMNKGIKEANGEIIGFLNSDDLYIDNTVIKEVVKVFETSGTDIIFGDLYYVKQNDTNYIVRKWHTKQFKQGSFKKGWHPPHPTFIVKKKVYQNFGGFDLSFILAADFEIMLRFLEKHKISNIYINKPLIKMRLGGATNKNYKNIYIQNKECFKAFHKNKIKVSIFYTIFRLIPKFLQYLTKN